MSYRGPKALRRAVAALAKLPGIGERTAQRLVLHLVHAEPDYVKELTETVSRLKTEISLCSVCCGLTDTDPCEICQNPNRDQGLVCVVEEPSDLLAVERSGQFKGLYHVLHGSLAPLDGIGPDQLKIAELLRRVEKGSVREMILATNPDVEGEATALYLAKVCAKRGLPVSRIAMGIPMGGHLEYTDLMLQAEFQ